MLCRGYKIQKSAAGMEAVKRLEIEKIFDEIIKRGLGQKLRPGKILRPEERQ